MTSTMTSDQITGKQPLSTSKPKHKPILVNTTVSAIARQTSDQLPPELLYLLNGTVVTIEVEQKTSSDNTAYTTTEIIPMTSERFSSWINDVAGVYYVQPKRDGKELVDELVTPSPQLCARILAADSFKRRLPVVKQIFPTRLPVWGCNNQPTLAEAGYNAKTQALTLETLPYPTDAMPKSLILANLYNLLKAFPWGELADDEDNPQPTAQSTPEEQMARWMQSRSVSCYIAYLLKTYCRNLFIKAPLTIFSANQPGTGKTLLGSLGLAAVYGTANLAPTSRKPEEIQKILFSRLIAGEPYCFCDDVPSITEPIWAMYATAAKITDRLLGSNTVLTVENKMQIIATGNDLKTSADISRRSDIIDLFFGASAIEREIDSPLSAYTLDNAAFRADLLHILHSIVLLWAQAGCPKHCKGSDKPSFEAYAETVGSMVVNLGFGSPFAPRKNAGFGGNAFGDAIEKLIIEGAHALLRGRQTAKPNMLTTDDFLEIAKYHGLETEVAFGVDPRKSLGQSLFKYKSREYQTDNGSAFRIGKKKQSDRTRYEYSFSHIAAADKKAPLQD